MRRRSRPKLRASKGALAQKARPSLQALPEQLQPNRLPRL